MIETQHCPNCEAQAAEIEKLRQDHRAAVRGLNNARVRLKSITKLWYADRAALLQSRRSD
jgi:hypothetical protein